MAFCRIRRKIITLISLFILLIGLYYLYYGFINDNGIYGTFQKYEELNSVSFNSLEWDSSGEYRIWYNAKVGSKDSNHGIQVTIATQCSLSKISSIIKLSKTWEAQIHLGLLITKTEIEFALEAIAYLRQCHKAITEYVSFHIVIPDNGEEVKEDNRLRWKSQDELTSKCNAVDSVLGKLSVREANYGKQKVPYPVNLLRNVAMKHINSSHIMVIDIDMVPSSYQLMINNIKHALHEKLPKTALVLPAFEVESNIHQVPASRKEILDLLAKNKARPFYYEICWKCQKFTDYFKWESLPSDEVGYEVSWHDPWEPFYIIRTDEMITYDERFKQYGFNRISQICELNTAGYNFNVLKDAFLIHIGLKTQTSFHSTKTEENNKNRILFRLFKDELKIKYSIHHGVC